MAKCVITITDGDAGSLDMTASSDPAWPGPAAEDQTLTAAQQVTLALMSYAGQVIRGGAEEAGT